MQKKILVNGEYEMWEIKNTGRTACRALVDGKKFVDACPAKARDMVEKHIKNTK